MAIKYEKDEQNIVTLTLDLAGRGANVINAEFGTALANSLTRLQAEDDLAGVMIISAKKTFMAGADLENASLFVDAEAVFSTVEQLKAGFRQLETLGKPVVAALNGTALGGGLELALATHHRIALDNPKIKFGFPEVTLGLLPGGGGIVRLTRMLGLQASFPYLMEGKQLKPQAAQDAGLIDDLAADVEELIAKAKAWILANPNAKQPWDMPKFRMPGGDARRPNVVQMLAIAPAMLRKKTFGNYPAPEAIMDTAVKGSVVDFETASRIESRAFAAMATSKVARNMINAFWFQLNQINAGASRPDVPATETNKVGILGAGMMGHGIAYVTAWAGMDVVLKDVSVEAAQAGKEKVAAILQKQVSRGRVSGEEKGGILSRILPTGSASDLQGCDLIVEAVFEDRTLKAAVTQEAEREIGDTAVFASNTSTLPITGLAQASARPVNFIGLHFFSPVHKMKLVEIIVGAETSDQTVAKAFDYVLKIRKTPIVVNDSRGFYTSRVFGTYVNEGMALLSEGQHPRAVEMAGLQAGMPVGPLAVSDEVSLSLMAHIRKQTVADLAAEGVTMPEHPANKVLAVMLAKDRLGKAHGAGFYEYPAGGKKHLWAGLQTLFSANGKAKLSQEEMIDRLLFAQVLETVRCFEEGVFTQVADGNIGSIFGWGFAPFKGGTLQFVNDCGVAEVVTRSQELAVKYGDRFVPPKLLLEMAEDGRTF